MSCHCLLVSVISNVKSTVNFIVVPLYMMSPFSRCIWNCLCVWLSAVWLCWVWQISVLIFLRVLLDVKNNFLKSNLEIFGHWFPPQILFYVFLSFDFLYNHIDISVGPPSCLWGLCIFLFSFFIRLDDFKFADSSAISDLLLSPL